MEYLRLSPAPWQLQGNGYIFLYRFTKNFVKSNAFLSEDYFKKYWGLVGSVMLVDYHRSNVGAYQELLFIPSMFDFSGKKAFHISKIYVSTTQSVYNGIENWGIPKELADFEINTLDKHTKNVKASLQGNTFFQIQVKSFGFAFPITTSLFPFTFYQDLRGKTLITKPRGNGWGRLCRIEQIKVDSLFFPDIALFNPLLVIEVRDFQLEFPVAQVLS
ncbi:acetoacetate decarboxylase family protein [Thermoflexibacter ruber]|uniref:Acetoacetate decarboxylase (ADC) n=1 Tax=Thermoflexibacter ruber TaxID=1003 RepID=A0A1I2AX14_9BACT|nr:acetoacetate decarboxylase family protein [Thermoflexibacter ruber]SFE48366.1 Acetoacetate decarboxylase (ADC) [Thermoflexibacter ruber]